MAKKLYSSYWVNDTEIFDEDEGEQTVEEKKFQKILRLAALRRATANFVSIISKENLPVIFSSGQDSYTDGKHVIISADPNPNNFDVTVGLALHEGSHVLLSDFNWLNGFSTTRSIIAQWGRMRAVDAGNHWQRWRDVWNDTNYASKSGYCAALDILHPNFIEWLEKNLNDGQSLKGDLVDHDKKQDMVREINIFFDYLHTVMNILEDRRIDKHIYQTAGGYRPYYDAMYAKYFFTAPIGKSLKYDPEWRKPTIENYLNRLLFFFHPDNDINSLPGLDALYALMDISNIDRVAPENDTEVDFDRYSEEPNGTVRDAIAYDEMPNLYKVASNILVGIYALTHAAETQEKDVEESDDGPGVPMPDQGEDDSGLPNMDGGIPQIAPADEPRSMTAPDGMEIPQDLSPMDVELTPRGEEGKYNEKTTDNQVKKATDVLEGKLKKKKLSKKDQASVEAFEEAEGTLENLNGHGLNFGEVFVTRKVTRKIMEQEWFIFAQSMTNWDGTPRLPHQDKLDAISRGRRLGNILHDRLMVRNDPLVTYQTRRASGKIDRRLLANLGMDITSVFQRITVDIHKPVMLHLSIDASGSMGGKRWLRTSEVAVALATIADKMQNIDVVISLRGGSDQATVAIVYDSRKDRLREFLKLWAYMGPSGATPEGICYQATMDLILEATDTHKVYFVNFSDGEPSFRIDNPHRPTGMRKWDYGATVSYWGDFAFDHTRKMVNMMKEHGIEVLSYFICNSEPDPESNSAKNFKRMYGEDAEFINPTQATKLLKTLNKKLIVRG